MTLVTFGFCNAFALAVCMTDATAASNTLSREEVVQKVLTARADGELVPAGPGYDGPPAYDRSGKSSVTRTQVDRLVILARDHGQLAPAGEAGDSAFTAPLSTTSRVSRAQVRAQTLQARAAGQLIPAGEDVDGADGGFETAGDTRAAAN